MIPYITDYIKYIIKYSPLVRLYLFVLLESHIKIVSIGLAINAFQILCCSELLPNPLFASLLIQCVRVCPYIFTCNHIFSFPVKDVRPEMLLGVFTNSFLPCSKNSVSPILIVKLVKSACLRIIWNLLNICFVSKMNCYLVLCK